MATEMIENIPAIEYFVPRRSSPRHESGDTSTARNALRMSNLSPRRKFIFFGRFSSILPPPSTDINECDLNLDLCDSNDMAECSITDESVLSFTPQATEDIGMAQHLLATHFVQLAEVGEILESTSVLHSHAYKCSKCGWELSIFLNINAHTIYDGRSEYSILINPRCACAARLSRVCSRARAYVCVCVCVFLRPLNLQQHPTVRFRDLRYKCLEDAGGVPPAPGPAGADASTPASSVRNRAIVGLWLRHAQ